MITPQLIKEIREKTGAGMLDCKKALTESDGDMEKAIEWLRKKGLAAAGKKSGRVTSDGLISISKHNSIGFIIEVNSETDFVAKNDKFKSLVGAILETYEANPTFSINELKDAKCVGSEATVQEMIAASIATMGENINLRRIDSIKASHVYSYMHNAIDNTGTFGKIGVLLAVDSDASYEEISVFGRQVSMHIAASKPFSVSIDDLDQSLIENERRIFAEISAQSGKPKEIIEKMVDGRITKYYKEVVLLEQPFVIDPKISVNEFVNNTAKEKNKSIKIVGFKLFILGDGIEKEQADFASEVASMAN